jgi:hypothetical protein
MNAKFQFAFDALEQQRTSLLDGIRMLPADVLNAAPAGKWSALRILSHIIAAEGTGLSYVRKKMLGVKDTTEAGLWESFKLGVFRVSQRLPMLKYKVPRVIEERTVVHHDLATIELEWKKVRAEWRTLLESVPDEYVNRKIFRHVVGGRFTLDQGLVIFGEHLRHHVPQIRERVTAKSQRSVDS